MPIPFEAKVNRNETKTFVENPPRQLEALVYKQQKELCDNKTTPAGEKSYRRNLLLIFILHGETS